MMRPITLAILLFAVLICARPVAAQSPTPPDSAGAEWTQIGAGALVLLAVKEALSLVLPLVSGKTEQSHAYTNALTPRLEEAIRIASETRELVEELHAWHNVQDPVSGRPVWYGLGVPKLERTLEVVARNIEAQTEVLKQVLEITHRTNQTAAEQARLLKELREERMGSASH